MTLKVTDNQYGRLSQWRLGFLFRNWHQLEAHDFFTGYHFFAPCRQRV